MFSRGFPFSLALFLFTAVVFVLQWIPYIGVFLWIAGAMFWSVLTVNLAFLLIVVDCKISRLPKWLLIVPVIWFGGYLSAAVLSQQQAHALAEDALAHNADKKIAFRPNDDRLLIEPNAYYVVSPERLAGEYDAFADLRGTAPFNPTHYLLRIDTTKTMPIESLLLDGETRDIEMTHVDGHSVALRTGIVRPLPWFPMPVVGCLLGKCVVAFYRPETIVLGSRNGTVNYPATDVVANALSLRQLQ